MTNVIGYTTVLSANEKQSSSKDEDMQKQQQHTQQQLYSITAIESPPETKPTTKITTDYRALYFML